MASTLGSVAEVERVAVEFASTAGLGADAAGNIGMVAREAAANAVLHGNQSNPAVHFAASFELSAEALVIRIADSGPGLDPLAIPDPLAPENLLRSSGRGVFLMRALMDEVSFRPLYPGSANPGNEVLLIKHLDGTPLRVGHPEGANPHPGSAPRHLKDTKPGEKTMSLKSTPRTVDGITILDLSGRITLGEGSVTLRDLVKDALGKGSKTILLNLANVDYIDSSGLGELVSAFTTVKNQGGELKLLHLTTKVHDLLQITKLYTVFDIYDDEAPAVSSFAH